MPSPRLLITTQAVDMHDPVLGFFHDWLCAFAARCERVHVICLREGTYALPPNVFVYSLGKERGTSVGTKCARFFSLIFSLRNEYDAVFVHMNPEYVILGGVVWRMLHKKIVLWYTHKAVNLRLRVATVLAQCILTASPESFRLKSAKVHVMGHGINTELFFPPSQARAHDGTLRLLTVGRISKTKDIMTLVRAVEILVHRTTEQVDRGFSRIEFSVVGAPVTDADHAYARMLHEYVAEHGLQKNIRFVGAVPPHELPDVYHAHDIFLHASTTGSLDKAALEALACGLTVFSSNDGVAPGDVSFGRYAFVAGDAEGLVEKIVAARSPASGFVYVQAHHALPALIDKIMLLF